MNTEDPWEVANVVGSYKKYIRDKRWPYNVHFERVGHPTVGGPEKTILWGRAPANGVIRPFHPIRFGFTFPYCMTGRMDLDLVQDEQVWVYGYDGWKGPFWD